MKKIPTLFERDPRNRSRVIDKVNPLCAWVLEGLGTALKKYDGTCCKVWDGMLWKRRETKQGKRIPIDFVSEEQDPTTGTMIGWVPVTSRSEDVWHIEAFGKGNLPDGTYELCGPKIQGNPEGFEKHVLVAHKKATIIDNVTRTFEGIEHALESLDIEGIVFWNSDGRRAKIKKRDYGLERTKKDNK